jgi:endoglucanase
VNITGWFRFPASHDPAALRAWMSDPAMRHLHAAGFTFVRLAVDPALLQERPATTALIDAIRRLQQAGLAVVVSLHPAGWALETSAADRTRLHAAWGSLAAELHALDPARTFPELLNEPVFPNDAAGWGTLQHALLGEIRGALPANTVVLTGQDWGSISGLLNLTPEADPNVVYSFHFYDPAELTALAPWRQGLDRAALARLPFPADDIAACQAVAERASDEPTRGLMRFYCALRWDAARIAAAIGRAAAWGQQHHAMLLAGEFGASTEVNRPARLAWLRSVRQGCEAASIGWALWGYDDVMGFAVSRPPPRKPVLDRDVLAALGLSATE